jgi:prepilin-type N-terminal cleavage/methylation domain-containing protein
MKRGSTLVELMITVALLGIVAGGALSHGQRSVRRAAQERLQQERASQVLEYEAEAVSTGASVDQGVEGALLEELPGASVSARRAGPTTTIELTWHAEGATRTRSLTVFTGHAR